MMLWVYSKALPQGFHRNRHRPALRQKIPASLPPVSDADFPRGRPHTGRGGLAWGADSGSKCFRWTSSVTCGTVCTPRTNAVQWRISTWDFCGSGSHKKSPKIPDSASLGNFHPRLVLKFPALLQSSHEKSQLTNRPLQKVQLSCVGASADVLSCQISVGHANKKNTLIETFPCS